MDEEDCQRARKLHVLYSAFDEATRRHLRIPLERLNSAMHRPLDADAAIDIRIAIESALLDEGDRGEFRFRASLRAARLLGTGNTDRIELMRVFQDLYDLGSEAVHTGGLPQRYRGQQSTELLNEGFSRVGQVVESIMREGGVDWQEVTLG